MDLLKIKNKEKCSNCNTVNINNLDSCSSCGTDLKIKNYTRLAHFIAGIILFLNGLFLFLEEVFITSTDKSIGNPVTAIIASIVIGTLLILGNEKGLKWAKFAVIFGAVLYPIIYFSQNDMFMVFYQMVFSASLLMLLFGNPGKIRILVCSFLAISYFGLEVIGIHYELTGENLIVKVAPNIIYDLEDIENYKAKGSNFDYSIQIPVESSWEKMKYESMLIENPEADLWLVNPGFDAHIVVVAESVEVGMDFFTTIVKSTAQLNIENYNLVDSLSFVSENGNNCNVLDISGISDGINFYFKYGIYVDSTSAYQIICVVSEELKEEVINDFNSVIKSFVY